MLDEKRNFYYMRLSLEDGDVVKDIVNESDSIYSQRKCIINYLQRKGFDISHFEELADDGYSGTNMDRPGMSKLLKLVQAGKVGTIVVRDLSRFSRDYLEAGYCLEILFPLMGVRFISINDSFDSNDLGESTGGIHLAIVNLVNQLYSMDISDKIKSVVDLKKMNGEYVYGTAPYGYMKGEKKNTILIDTEVAPIVKQIFEWAAEGITITQIARLLNEKNIQTPSEYLKERRGKYKTSQYWSFSSVFNIIDNRIYTGDTVPFKSHVVKIGSNKVKHIPKELQVVINNTHEPIVSLDLYEKAHKVIKSTVKKKTSAINNPLNSKLICGCCGKTLKKGKSSNKTWLCDTRRYTDKTECINVRANDQKTKEVVLKAIIVQCCLFDAKLQQIKAQSEQVKNEEHYIKREARQLSKRISELETIKISLYEEYIEGRLSKEVYLKKRETIIDELDNNKAQYILVQKRIEEIKSRNNIVNETEEHFGSVGRYKDITELSSQIMEELVDKIIVYPNNVIHIDWKFKDKITELLEIPSIAQ